MQQHSAAVALIRRATRLWRDEGITSLLRHASSFLAYILGRQFTFRRVFLYEHSLVPRDRSSFLPRLESWELRVLHSNTDADAVVAEGLEDLRMSFIYATRSLNNGAIAFCVYVETKLVHVGWLAVDAQGKRAVDRMPFEVAFESGQACTGGTYTNPRYRGKGLMPYGYYERFEYLRARGFTSSRNSVEVDNIASQKAHARFDPTIYGLGRYRKVLWWHSWQVEQLPGGPRKRMPANFSGSYK